MNKRFSTKLLSTVLSVAIAAMGTLVCPLSASAAYDVNQIPIFIDNIENKTQYGDAWGPSFEGGGYSNDSGGSCVWISQVNTRKKSTDRVDGKVVKPGGSSSDYVKATAYNVYYKGWDIIPEGGNTEGATLGGVPTGDPLSWAGQSFRSGWPIKTHNLSENVDTGMVSMQVRIDDEAFIRNACIVLCSGKNGDGGVNQSTAVGVPLGDQYTVDDAGTWKQINIPLSAFVYPDENAAGSGFDPSAFAGAGLGFTNKEELTARTFVYYDNFYVCNVPAPRKLTIDSATDSEVNLSWRVPLGEATQYEILRTDEEGNTEALAMVDASQTTYTDSTVELGKTYTYAVRTINSVGTASINSNEVEAYIALVGSPQNFTAVSSFGNELKVELAWEVPTYPSDLTDVTYNVYRQKLGEDTPELIAEGLVDTAFTDTTDTGMTNNTEYTYYVRSTLDGDESMPSTKITLAAAYIGIPQNLLGSYSIEDKSVTLTWDAVDNAESYNVYRDDEKIANVDTSAYTDEGLEYSYNYKYEVTAVCDTNESLPSDSVIEIIPDPAIDTSVQTIVFDERAQNGYSAGALGGSTTGITDENYVMGEMSYKISFATGATTVNGASFKKPGVDMTSLRENGGMLSFYVYGASKDVIDGVKVGFECTASSKAVRTSVDLDDYIGGRYGKWVFVQIPMSDFAAKGTYTGTGTTSGSLDFNYASVNSLMFFTDEIHTQIDKTIYLDDVMFTKYVTPQLETVTYGEGTAITEGGTVTSETPITTIKVAFDKEMDADTVTDTTVVLEEAGVKKTVVAECDGNVITLTIPSGLKSDKAYTLKLDGVKSMEKGTVVADYSFNTATVAEISAITFPENAEGAMKVAVPSSSVTKGDTATVKVTIADGVARKATVTGGKITIDYTSTVLTAYDADITISSVLKNAGADVKVETGKITITLPSDAELILGDAVATIKFRSSATGKATVTANAELTDTVDTKLVLDKAEESFTVKNATSGQGQVSNRPVSDTSNIGGGRDTTPVREPITVTDTETNTGDKDLVFSDVKVDNWAKKHIEYLYEIKYISGYDDGTFRPDQSVSREEFLKMLLNAASVDTTDAETTFGDITADDWCYSVVAAAERDGIINGDNGNFGKGRSITREDMCTMVARAAEKYNIKLNVQYSADLFDDYNNISDYAQESVTKLQTAGIINGMGDGTFAPKGEVTRAMAAKVIYEIVQLIIKG